MNQDIRLRIAPSPTGYVHLGNIYAAHFNRTLADKWKGKLIWRSEDTDRTRLVVDANEVLKQSLAWFGITIDEGVTVGGEYGPYIQSERTQSAIVDNEIFNGNIYLHYAKKLIEFGHAYYAFESKEELEQMRNDQIQNKQQPKYDKRALKLSPEEISKKLAAGDPFVIRLNVPEDEMIECYDELRGKIDFESNTIDDQVLIKEDGFPTYHLAVVVDDYLMKISHVVRASDWLPSLPKQTLLYKFLGWEMPMYIHIPVILKEHGEGKLSKREGASNAFWYRYKGYLPEAIRNYLSNLGFSHPEEKDVYPYSEFVEVFDLKRVLTQLPRFDQKKLDWVNGQYIRSNTIEEFKDKFESWLSNDFNYLLSKLENVPESELATPELISKFKAFYDKLDEDKKSVLYEINQSRIKYFEELIELNRFLYDELDIQDSEQITKTRTINEVTQVINWLINEINLIDDWTLDELKKLEQKVITYAQQIGWKNAEIFTPIRILVAKRKVSPPLFESIYLLGKEKTINNLTFIKQL